MSLTLTTMELPSRCDESGPRGDAFRAFHAFTDRVNDVRFGPGVIQRSAQERLVMCRSTPEERTETLLAHETGRLVGSVRWYVPLLENTDVCEIGVSVDPALPAERADALFAELLDVGEQYALDAGRTALRSRSRVAAGGPIAAATGAGGADPGDPEVAELVARGYALEQVYRISVADVRELPDLDERLAAARAGAPDYDLAAWEGPTPQPHRVGMRRMKEGMSTDAPGSGTLFDPEVWDDQRLTHFEAHVVDGGRTSRTVAAFHRASGEMAGFTSIFVGSGDMAVQHDTYVLGDHRGHGLGLLMKLANLVELRAHHPGHPRLTTWNAEENRPMLAVNEATGFRAVSYDGVWGRRA